MRGINVLQAKYPNQDVNSRCNKNESEISDHQNRYCKKIILFMSLLTAGLLTAILLFTIHTMLTVQNIDAFVRLGYKMHQTASKSMMETMSQTGPQYDFTTAVIPSDDIPSTEIVTHIEQVFEAVSREQWNAEFPKNAMKLITPVDMVIISHTGTQNCNTSTVCAKLIKSMQRYHIEERRWWDIGYNFIVGGDGKVYEGRGWTCVGSHTSGYNRKSIGIALTGDFETKIPPRAQIEACKELIKTGVFLGYVDKYYKLFGASQLVATTSPGKALLEDMETWPHFFEKV